MRALPEPQRAAVLLAYYEGLSYREVGRRLAIAEGTAKSRLRAALRVLERTLRDRGLDPRVDHGLGRRGAP